MLKGPVAYLFTEFKVYRFAITAYAVQHARFDATSTHSSLTQLARAPVYKGESFKITELTVHKLHSLGFLWLY